jgi:hypothetical protein
VTFAKVYSGNGYAITLATVTITYFYRKNNVFFLKTSVNLQTFLDRIPNVAKKALHDRITWV